MKLNNSSTYQTSLNKKMKTEEFFYDQQQQMRI